MSLSASLEASELLATTSSHIMCICLKEGKRCIFCVVRGRTRAGRGLRRGHLGLAVLVSSFGSSAASYEAFSLEISLLESFARSLH